MVTTVIAYTAPKLKQSLFLTLDKPVLLTQISQRGRKKNKTNHRQDAYDTMRLPRPSAWQ